MVKRVSVIKESHTGRNEIFRDNYSGKIMSGKQFVNRILKGKYGNCHIRVINGIPTPVSNPDESTENNLG